MAGWEFVVFGVKKGCFEWKYGKVCSNRKLLACGKGWLLRIAKARLVQKESFCAKKTAFECF